MCDGKASHNGPKNRNRIQSKIHYYIMTTDSEVMENNVGEEDVKTEAPKPFSPRHSVLTNAPNLTLKNFELVGVGRQKTGVKVHEGVNG